MQIEWMSTSPWHAKAHLCRIVLKQSSLLNDIFLLDRRDKEIKILHITSTILRRRHLISRNMKKQDACQRNASRAAVKEQLLKKRHLSLLYLLLQRITFSHQRLHSQWLRLILQLWWVKLERYLIFWGYKIYL